MSEEDSSIAHRGGDAVPGLGGTLAVAALGWMIARWLAANAAVAPDAVVCALLLGLVIRSVWHPPASWDPGLGLASRQVLEVAIVLLGFSTDLRVLMEGGVWLVAGVVGVTVFALGGGITLGRWLGLTRTHALLVASGNAICGNSAIAAVATVVRAPAREAASAIAYTAVLSIGVVLVLPVIGTALGLGDAQYGVLAGMTVYAVPQVLAATYPVSHEAGEVGTLVKVIRVLCLLPWLTLLSMRERHTGRAPVAGGHLAASVLPPYLLVFIGLTMLRTFGAVPDGVLMPARLGSHALTTLAMAALGLSVAPAALRAVGWRTAVAATGALVLLLAAALLVARST